MENQESLLWVIPILHLFFSMALPSLRYIRGKGETTEGRCEVIFSHKILIQIFNKQWSNSLASNVVTAVAGWFLYWYKS